MAKEGLIAVGAGAVSALALASVPLTGSAVAMPVMYLAPVPLYLAGLGYGANAAGFALLGGTMVAGLLGGLLLALVYAAAYGVPAWTVTRILLAAPPTGAARGDGGAGRALAALSLMAFAAVAVSAFYAVGSGVPLEMQVRDSLDAAFAQLGASVPADARGEAVAQMAAVMPGMAASAWVLMTVISAVLAQAVLNRYNRAPRPSPAYAALRLPDWASWPLVAAAALSLIADGDLEYAGRNLTFVAAVPFFFLGLAAIHTIVRKVQGTTLILTGVYLVVAFSGWAQMVVAGLGVMELWVGVRRRFAGSPKERENE